MDIFDRFLTVHDVTVLTGPNGNAFLRDDFPAPHLSVITRIERTVTERTILALMMAWIVSTIRVRTHRWFR